MQQGFFKKQDGLRPVIYYMEHLLQDTDSSQMLSRSWVSFVRFKHPGIIVHPILTFVSDLLWENLAAGLLAEGFGFGVRSGCFLLWLCNEQWND